MNEKSTMPEGSGAAPKDGQSASSASGQDLNLLNQTKKAEAQQAGHAQVDTGITETDRNNFDDEQRQDTKKGAGHQ